MSLRPLTDITNRPDSAAISLLVCFGESVKTHAGQVELLEDQETFRLTQYSREHLKSGTRDFRTAAGAIEVLRRISEPKTALAA